MNYAGNLVSAREAADITGRSIFTINRWHKEGLIQPVSSAPRRLFRLDDINNVAESRLSGRRPSKQALVEAIRTCARIVQSSPNMAEAVARITRYADREEKSVQRLAEAYAERHRELGK